MTNESLDTPVLIVGAGPAGLSLAVSLARLGIPSILTERRDTKSNHPRAHWTNTRTMELFGLWGMSEPLHREGFPPERLHLKMIEQFGGTSMAERERFSPAMSVSVAQDIVERELHHAIEPYEALVTTAMGHELTDFTDHGDHVAATFQTAAGPRTITARWMAAGDGANSLVRTRCGVDMIGHPALGSIINIYFDGQITPHGEGSLGMQSKNPDKVIGSFISMDGFRRWCFHCHYDPAVEQPEDFDVARCEQIVRTAAAVSDDTPIEVRSIRPWTMTALVAMQFKVGNIFLIGDAAHAFPPSGGMGLNSGVQDGYNLAWKLAYVYQGLAGPDLLDSYNIERRPIACLNTAQSFRNAVSGKLLGFKSIEDVDAAMLAHFVDHSNPTVRSTAAGVEDPHERKLWESIEHGAPLGQELGFAYAGSPAVVEDGVARPDVWIGRYVENACPGVRAPHLFGTLPDGRTISSIDLFDSAMTLATLGAGSRWRDALARSDFAWVRSVIVGKDWSPDIDHFKTLYDIGDGGVVLVRPDGHVAFRSAGDGDPATLVAALHAILAVPHVAVAA